MMLFWWCCAALILASFVVSASSLSSVDPLELIELRHADVASWQNDDFITEPNLHRSHTTEQKAGMCGSTADWRITLVTHLTPDRWYLLARWCKAWRGPISASVFVAPGTMFNVSNQVKLDACLSNFADLHLVMMSDSAAARHVASASSSQNMLVAYPFNVARQLAMRNALTPLVFLVDVDLQLGPSEQWRERKLRDAYKQMRDAHPKHFPTIPAPTAVRGASHACHPPLTPTVSVIPTVESLHSSILLPKTLAELRDGLRNLEFAAFYGHSCKSCHGPTELDRFVSMMTAPAGSSTRRPYAVRYVDKYEPYVIADARLLPPYDGRFVGRGWSKMSFFFEIAQLLISETSSAARREFAVLPIEAFLVHVGRGNDPAAFVSREYDDRQRESRAHYENFKDEISRWYSERYSHDAFPTCTAASAADGPSQLESCEQAQDEDSRANQRETFVRRWGPFASSEIGADDACVLVARPDDVGPANASFFQQIQETIIAAGCGELGAQACVALGVGGAREFPMHPILRGEWVLDRVYRLRHRAAGSPRAWTTRRKVCESITPLARLISCSRSIKVCVAGVGTALADSGSLQEALRFACNPANFANCAAVFNPLFRGGKVDDVHFATAAFTAYFLTHRCPAPLESDACHFQGAAHLRSWDDAAFQSIPWSEH